MKWTSVNNYGEMSRYGAERIFAIINQKIKARQRVNIGLATGNTMIKLYAVLAGMLNQSGLNLEKLASFNLDEYIGPDGNALPTTDLLSYRKYMTEHFFDLLDPKRGFKKENMFYPNATDTAQYDGIIADAGGLDIQLLGIGFNGHIAFNEPISETKISQDGFAALPSHIVKLSELTIKTNARLTAGNDLAAVPRHAATMGMSSILNADDIILLACFPEQTAPLKEIKAGKISSELPASFLLKHPNSEIAYTNDIINL
ncbi:MAG: glucosamine-6-phosphate deaminase [Lentisphaeria bacterium]